MSGGRVSDGGKGRSDTEVDDEDTVVAAAPLFDEAAVEVALGQIVETVSVETEPRGERPSPVERLPPQAFVPPQIPGPTTAPLPTVAPPRRFSTTAPMPTVAPPVAPIPTAAPTFPPVAPMPTMAPPFPQTAPMPTMAPPFPPPAPMPTMAPLFPPPAPIPTMAPLFPPPAVPPVPVAAPVPRSLPSAANLESRSTRYALVVFALFSILWGGIGLGWFLLAGHRDVSTIQAPPVAPPAPKLVPRHVVAPTPATQRSKH